MELGHGCESIEMPRAGEQERMTPLGSVADSDNNMATDFSTAHQYAPTVPELVPHSVAALEQSLSTAEQGTAEKAQTVRKKLGYQLPD